MVFIISIINYIFFNYIYKSYLSYCLNIKIIIGTLIWGAQKADEIFENLTVITLLHSSFIHKNNINSIKLRIFIHSILSSLGIWCIPEVFCEVHLIIICFFTVYKFYHKNDMTKHDIKRITNTSIFALLGFSLWICDFFFCNYFKKLYLHAYGWHTLTGLALYNSGLLLKGILNNNKIRK
jgi:hypothetical protein